MYLTQRFESLNSSINRLRLKKNMPHLYGLILTFVFPAAVYKLGWSASLITEGSPLNLEPKLRCAE